MAQNDFLLFRNLLVLGPIFQAWNCTVLNVCAIGFFLLSSYTIAVLTNIYLTQVVQVEI